VLTQSPRPLLHVRVVLSYLIPVHGCVTDNFLTGTLPAGLSRLHLLRDLQMGHNQLEMQDRESLAALLGGMLHLKTLDIGMSDEKPAFEKTLIQPTPPITCRVGDECSLRLVTRTIDSVQLPHGGVRMSVKIADGSEQACACVDHMDGSYECVFPPSWTSRRGEFDFTVLADGEEITPLRTRVNPTTGAESTENAYNRLGCLVLPLLCQQPHSFVNEEGAVCLCEAGYYRNEYEGGWDCATCIHGEEPIEQGTRCRKCPFGTYSSSGHRCISCAPGEEPNLAAAADACVRCGPDSISGIGSDCTRCPVEFVADDNRTLCICPAGTYNSTGFSSGHAVQCLGDLHGDPPDIDAPSLCMPCNDACIDCSTEIPKIRQGWATAGTDAMPSRSPWLLFQCPVQQACANKPERRCREGHSGMLCNVCEVGYGLEDGECQLCSGVSSQPVFLLVLAAVALIGGVAYARRVHRAEDSGSSASSLEAQLTTDNPLQGSGPLESVDKRQSLSTSTVQHTDDAYMLLRVLYQPVRILVGYVQVVSQIGACSSAHPVTTKPAVILHASAGDPVLSSRVPFWSFLTVCLVRLLPSSQGSCWTYLTHA
jgi:hypothetical protein